MSLGLISTGICNILVSISYNINLITIFWSINAIFQGCGWPPVTKQLTYWYDKKERGLWWGICSTSHNIGGAIIPIIIGFLSSELGWRKSMNIIGIICIFVGLVLMNRLRDKPSSIGIPNIKIKNKKKKYIKKKKIHY